VSPCITTPHVEASRDFYVQHFGATVAFDGGWYVSLEFGAKSRSIQFMAPQSGQAICRPEGLIYNFCVDNVDAEYQKLVALGLTITMPIADHAWGDRGFSVVDPNGITLYLYSEREPTAEFVAYRKA
jgi:uncharacterized glyoxalase superfamily protein PhnB